MSTFQHMSRGLNNINRQTRILEAEISMDARRGVTIPKKQEKLEKLKEQQDRATNNLIETMKQMIENDKKFLDSFNETTGRIRDELEKDKEKEEEQQLENIMETTWAGNASGSIVDVTIPSTVVSILPANNNDDLPKDANSQATAGVMMPKRQQAETTNNTESTKQPAEDDEKSLDLFSEIKDRIQEELEKKEEQQAENTKEIFLNANIDDTPKDADSQMNIPV